MRKEEYLQSIIKYHVTAAKELCYPKKVVRALRLAKSENECIRIMTDARTGAYDDNKKSFK